jgi:hypothetical protein
MPEDGMATWANEARDLVCINPADHGELYPAIAYIKEIGDVGSRCDSQLRGRIAACEPSMPTTLGNGVLVESRITIPHNR